ncbi:MAG: ThuA domain-containing protein [Verrucomicrobiales bacterium]|nr:ThuA domain-containing protein [Verrucomicrobiales bacterium]
MKRILPLFLVAAVSLSGWLLVNAAEKAAPKPLRVLLVAGGCCHDYATQTKLLKAGLESRINAVVDIDFNEDKSTKATFARYQSADWAQGYDVVIHDECSADVTDPAYVKRILDAHRGGVPAVNLHCGMHSYRWGNFREPVKPGADNAGWYEMLGLHSTGHGPQEPIDITYVDSQHPITVGLANWTTIKEELYNNIEIYPSARPLAKGLQMVKPRPKKGEPADPNAKAAPVEAVVAWTNEYGPGKTRIFSTTIGHNNETVADDRYLDLVARGLLWATGKIEPDGKPSAGYGK